MLSKNKMLYIVIAVLLGISAVLLRMPMFQAEVFGYSEEFTIAELLESTLESFLTITTILQILSVVIVLQPVVLPASKRVSMLPVEVTTVWIALWIILAKSVGSQRVNSMGMGSFSMLASGWILFLIVAAALLLSLKLASDRKKEKQLQGEEKTEYN